MPRETVAAPDCATLALYGVASGAEAAERFYHSALTWFRACGHTPGRVSVYGPGFTGKWGGLSRADGRLRRQGFQGDTAIALVAMRPGGEIPLVDWLMTAEWSAKHDYATIAAQGSIVPFASDGFRRCAEDMVRV